MVWAVRGEFKRIVQRFVRCGKMETRHEIPGMHGTALLYRLSTLEIGPNTVVASTQ